MSEQNMFFLMYLLTQAQLDDYIRRLEEAEMNIRIAEAKIAERDLRIGELERLLDCMGMVTITATTPTYNIRVNHVTNPSGKEPTPPETAGM